MNLEKSFIINVLLYNYVIVKILNKGDDAKYFYIILSGAVCILE